MNIDLAEATHIFKVWFEAFDEIGLEEAERLFNLENLPYEFGSPEHHANYFMEQLQILKGNNNDTNE